MCSKLFRRGSYIILHFAGKELQYQFLVRKARLTCRIIFIFGRGSSCQNPAFVLRWDSSKIEYARIAHGSHGIALKPYVDIIGCPGIPFLTEPGLIWNQLGRWKLHALNQETDYTIHVANSCASTEGSCIGQESDASLRVQLRPTWAMSKTGVWWIGHPQWIWGCPWIGTLKSTGFVLVNNHGYNQLSSSDLPTLLSIGLSWLIIQFVISLATGQVVRKHVLGYPQLFVSLLFAFASY